MCLISQNMIPEHFCIFAIYQLSLYYKSLNLWFPTDFGPCPTLVFRKTWRSSMVFYSYICINLVSKQAPSKYCMPSPKYYHAPIVGHMPHIGNYYSNDCDVKKTLNVLSSSFLERDVFWLKNGFKCLKKW